MNASERNVFTESTEDSQRWEKKSDMWYGEKSIRVNMAQGWGRMTEIERDGRASN